MTRRNVMIPDELWQPVVEAAQRQAPEGERPSASAWIREAIREKLARDATPACDG